MTSAFARILAGKREFRQRLATRPIAEKLAMLDALRERTLAVRPPPSGMEAVALCEEASPCRAAEEDVR